MKKLSFLKVTYIELVSAKSFVSSLFFAFLYILFSVCLLNYRLVIATIVGDFPLLYKLTVMFNLLLGTWTGLSLVDFSLLIATAILVGVNIFLLARTIYLLQHASKRVRFSIGGATLVSIITTGCTSCGLSLLSILGLSASLSFLPFHGMELHIGALFLLFISALYMLKQLWNAKYCKIS